MPLVCFEHCSLRWGTSLGRVARTASHWHFFLWMTEGATVAKGVILTFWTELFVRFFKDVIGSGQIIATSHDLTRKVAEEGKSPYFREI